MADWELKKIKKIYGENFMKLCRELFPIILEQDGKLYEIITSSFSTNSKTLYEDIINNDMIEEFKDHVFSKIDIKKPTEQSMDKTPYEILDVAGYILTECKTEEDIQAFKKYYEPGEELCTFWGGRLERCEVFWAVRKDVENIKRKNFKHPQREDEYGTSVMSIQFSKGETCTVSIKNRYNHKVNNPDATYGSNLNRIAPGLEQSFADLLKKRGLKLNIKNIENEFELPGYIEADNGKYYKYNMEINGTYYCPGNIVIRDGNVYELKNPEQEILIDYFVLNLKDKTIQTYDTTISESFPDTIQNIKKINIEKAKDGVKTITIETEKDEHPIIIKIDKDNQIIGYKNETITELNQFHNLYTFMGYNDGLQEIDLPNLTSVGDNFLKHSNKITKVNFPNLSSAGEDFLYGSLKLKKLELPNLEIAGNGFLYYSSYLEELNLPSLRDIGDCALVNTERLKKVNLPKLENAGDQFLNDAEELTEIDLPSIETVGEDFLHNGESIMKLHAPNLVIAGDGFMHQTTKITKLYLPNIEKAFDYFLDSNTGLTKVDMPKLKKAGRNFLKNSVKLTDANFPKLSDVDDCFLCNSAELRQLNLPNLQNAGNYFLSNAQNLERVEIPRLRRTGFCALDNAKKIKELNLPHVVEVGDDFLSNNTILSKLNAPELRFVGNMFLDNNLGLRELSLPSLTETGVKFMSKNTELESLYAPELWKIRDLFLDSNRKINRLRLKNTEVVDRIMRRSLNAREIARLDKKSQIKSSEIEDIRGILNDSKIQNQEHSKE